MMQISRLSLLFVCCLLPLVSSTASSLVRLSRAATHRFNTYKHLENDLVTLNYALTLEHLEATFYVQFQQTYNAQSFVDAGYNQTVWEYLEIIKAHEVSHVSALQQTIRNLNGVPVPPCTYNFSLVTSVATYIGVAAVLEGTGVSAYDGAINNFWDPTLQQVGATIATVEARHAAYLNLVNGQNPFPAAFDEAIRAQGIVQAILDKGLIVTCPYTIEYPVPRPNGSALSLRNGTNSSTLPTSTAYTPYTTEKAINDLNALNYALTLERLEAAFYRQFQSQFQVSDFEAAGYSATVYSYFGLIKEHEETHASAIAATIASRGGSPVPECVYNFSLVTNVPTYIAVSAELESTGVYAYDGAVNTITDLDLQQVAATIATVEARHTSFIRDLLTQVPFPNDFDIAIGPAGIIAAVLAKGFIVSCPYEIVLPRVLTVVPTTTTPTDAATEAPTNTPIGGNPTQAPDVTVAPTTTVPTGGAGTDTFPGPNVNPGICPQVSHSSSVSGRTITFSTNSDKTLEFVDAHVTAAGMFLNYRMIVEAESTPGAQTFTTTLPEFASGAISYWFTYVGTVEGVARGCDTPTENGSI